jgi:8-oxo-dGTP pyrophosphatase MutT (NUDIX family)
MFGLMIMRSDGRLGFPGGGVEEKCPSELDIVQALNRELMEEINYDARIGLQHYVTSHLHMNVKEGGRNLVTHFFIREVPSDDEFCRITRDYVKGK